MIDVDFLLAYGAVYRKVAEGEVIFMEGNRSNFYYQLISGKVKWVNINNDGRECLQAIIEAGESFGEMALFDDFPHVASAIAEVDSIVIKLHWSMFHQIIADHPEVQMAFNRMLTERLRFKFFQFRELFYSNPEERIAALINYFKQTKKNICPGCGKMKLTRQEIANMTCLRVETVIRAMRQMYGRGEITIRNGKVYFGNMNQVTCEHCSS